MARKPRIPPALRVGAFTLDEAGAAGVSPTALRGKSWRRLERGIYCWREVIVDPWRLLCALQRLQTGVVFAGRTAAWLHGIDIDPAHPIEVIVPRSSGMRSRRGVLVRRSLVAPDEVVIVRTVRATSPRRSLSDLCTRLAGVDALVLLDAALRKRLGRIDGPLGALAEPAESPMETRLRWVLLNGGLPRPEVQTNLHDASGRFVGRADLYYPRARLVIEFDGGNHRDRLVEDNRRQNLLLNSGFRLLRFTASDIYNRPETIVAQVSAAVAISAKRPTAARR